MNKKYFTSWVIVFVVWMIGSFMVHAIFIKADYMQVPNLFRTNEESQKYFPLMIFAHILMSGAFVWIYSNGAVNKSWLGQGIRYGGAIALLMIVPNYLINYVVQPFPLVIIGKQIIFDGVLQLLLGLVVAFLYRNQKIT